MTDLTTTAYRDCHKTVWEEAQNRTVIDGMRAALDGGLTQAIELQPGDGTKYQFTFVPAAGIVPIVVSNGGREPSVGRPVSIGTLLATITDGHRSFAMRFQRWQDVNDIAYMIERDAPDLNPVTRVAFAWTVYTLWSAEARKVEALR